MVSSQMKETSLQCLNSQLEHLPIAINETSLLRKHKDKDNDKVKDGDTDEDKDIDEDKEQNGKMPSVTGTSLRRLSCSFLAVFTFSEFASFRILNKQQKVH